MWVARFKLKDDEDIYSPVCERYKIDLFAYTYTSFIKNNQINIVAGGILSGSEKNKKLFIQEIRKDKRVKSIEKHHDFILVHAQHSLSREAMAELLIFYNPGYIKVKPIHVSSDGWEYWEIGCLNRNELNKVVLAAEKHYHGKLFSMKQEKIRSIASLEVTPGLTLKQFESLKTAFEEGYYSYPRLLTIPQLAKLSKKSYSTFQEHLRKAENKLIEYFLKYR
ncbi:MAG: helix-turn-helix domain-containing protein [Candidatus Woesearchaeota archaeon]